MVCTRVLHHPSQFGMPSEPINHMFYGLPSIRFGAGFLARTFCRLIKEMVDVAAGIASSPYYSSPEHHQDEQVTCYDVNCLGNCWFSL